jgi:hypothetical protein
MQSRIIKGVTVVDQERFIRLDNWSVTGRNVSPYQAPETIRRCLKGKAYGHPRFDDGGVVKTSYIVKADKRIITTRSGSVYQLGKIDPLYRRWLKINRSMWNWRKPITSFYNVVS